MTESYERELLVKRCEDALESVARIDQFATPTDYERAVLRALKTCLETIAKEFAR